MVPDSPEVLDAPTTKDAEPLVRPVEGAPYRDLVRSPAAAAIAREAARSGMFLAHYEHRVHLPVPEQWIPSERGDLRLPPRWQGGVLPESRYGPFRHDAAVAPFHPMHRGKWTAHALAHQLVGFGWWPRATLFELALAARLAEFIPIVVWYFLDEAGLRRCPLHQDGGPLFDDYCPACEEAAAGQGPAQPVEPWREAARDFAQRELERIDRSRAQGRLLPHRMGTVDLAADAVSYVTMHAPRLRSRSFARHMEQFHGPGSARHGSLEALHARVEAVLAYLLDDAPPPPALGGGRMDRVVRDFAWRLLLVRASSSGPVSAPLDEMLRDLADHPDGAGLGRVQGAYADLASGYDLPIPEDLLAVGYELPGGGGNSVRQLVDGLASACPATAELLGWRREALAARFLASDKPERRPLGRRVADFLAREEPQPLAQLGAFEAAVSHADTVDPAEALFGVDGARGELVALAQGFELLHAGYDVVELATGLQAGQPTVPAQRPTDLAVARGPEGDPIVVDLSERAAWALARLADGPLPRRELGLPAAEVATLEELGLLVAVRWRA